MDEREKLIELIIGLTPQEREDLLAKWKERKAISVSEGFLQTNQSNN